MGWKEWLGRITQWSICIPASKVAFGFIDFVVYPTAMSAWGTPVGATLVSLALLILSILAIIGYDRLGKDLFAIEAIKAVIAKGERLKVPIIPQIAQSGHVLAPGILAFLYQPYKVMVFCREPYCYRMRKRDWATLAACWVVRSVFWTIGMHFVGKDFVAQITREIWSTIRNLD